MKIPSLFRTPRHQKFEIKPRYYDPIREEVEAKTSHIRSSLKMAGDDNDIDLIPSRLSGSFKSKKSKNKAANFTQLIIMLLLVSVFVGYLYIGNMALYIFAIISSLLLYLKMKRIV